MLTDIKTHLSTLLEHVADSLDISRELHDEVVNQYREIANYLAAPDSPLQSADPDLYPQGSFSIGTVVRPVSDVDDYDIDMVCLLHLKKESVTQQELKDRIGDRLVQRPDLKRRLSESRRCWRLDFDGYHLDVLPAIPDLELLAANDSILITDTELRHWQHSNPKGFTAWFRQVMAVALLREKQRLVEATHFRMSIADVPDDDVKTPLQRAVQILKRHRDIHFAGEADVRPVSVILTTLAARAYNDEDNLVDALLAIVRRMPEHIEYRNGRWWVQNPVNMLENFADKWNEYPERRTAFMEWLASVQADFDVIAQERGSALYESLKPMFGDRIVINAARKLGTTMAAHASVGGLRMASGTGNILTPTMAVAAPVVSSPRHTFYGRVPKIKTP